MGARKRLEMGHRLSVQPLKWHGGKHYLARRIVGLMAPHLHYVEPFAGGLAVLLEKDPEGVSEVVNDVNFSLINFWRVLQQEQSFCSFCRIVEATPFSEEGWSAAAGGEIPDGPFDVQAAVNFFIRCRQSLAGRMKDFAPLSKIRVRRKMNEQVSAWLTAVDGLPEVHKRLRRVVILNHDACDVIREQDGREVLFYCDPPYLHEMRVSTNVYQYEMTSDQHQRLLEVLLRCKGKVVLSGYPSVLYDQMLSRWRTVDIDQPNNAANGKMKRRMVERLWLNWAG